MVDAILTLVAFIASSPPHVQMLLGAGIMPLLLDMGQILSERRDSVSD